MNYKWACDGETYNMSKPLEAQFVHYKPKKEPIPTHTPCGVPNGLTPQMWLAFSHDVDSITCPKCQTIAKESECYMYGGDKCSEPTCFDGIGCFMTYKPKKENDDA